jgi:hypothetical protein
MIDSMRNVKAPLLIFGIYFYTVKLTGEGITEIKLMLDSHLVCPYFSNGLTLGSLLYILIMSTTKKRQLMPKRYLAPAQSTWRNFTLEWEGTLYS